jgi:multimeric flavodoxin WrbA
MNGEWEHKPSVSHLPSRMYGHVLQMAEQIAEGVRKAGAIADIYQVSETLPEEVLEKMHAPPKVCIIKKKQKQKQKQKKKMEYLYANYRSINRILQLS